MWHKNGWNALNKRKPGHVKGMQFKGVRMSDHPFPHFLTSKDDLFLKSLNIKMHDQESNSSQLTVRKVCASVKGWRALVCTAKNIT